MELTGFVFGIRVNKSFAIEDKLGAIIDDILNHKDTSFNPDAFPKVKQSFGVRILINENSENQLKLTPEGIVLDYNVESSFEEEFEEKLNAFEEIVISDVFHNYKIRNINRVGFVIKSRIKEEDHFLKEIYQTIKNNYDSNPESLSIRFNTTKKTPQKIENIVTQDYESKILTYDRANNAEDFMFSVDYQKYFVPALNIIADMEKTFEPSFTKFCEKSLIEFKEKYFKNGIEEEEQKKR